MVGAGAARVLLQVLGRGAEVPLRAAKVPLRAAKVALRRAEVAVGVGAGAGAGAVGMRLHGAHGRLLLPRGGLARVLGLDARRDGHGRGAAVGAGADGGGGLGRAQGRRVGPLGLGRAELLVRGAGQVAVALEDLLGRDFGHVVEELRVAEHGLDVLGHLIPRVSDWGVQEGRSRLGGERG